ncbi:MAG: hypothetical protein RL099_768, partial [Bacteroidota bacterium]
GIPVVDPVVADLKEVGTRFGIQL